MRVTEQEIYLAVGHPVSLSTILNASESDLSFTEITDTPGAPWTCDTEDEAKGKLLEQIAQRAADCQAIIFRVWPEVGSRPDGKCSGYTRAAFA